MQCLEEKLLIPTSIRNERTKLELSRARRYKDKEIINIIPMYLIT